MNKSKQPLKGRNRGKSEEVDREGYFRKLFNPNNKLTEGDARIILYCNTILRLHADLVKVGDEIEVIERLHSALLNKPVLKHITELGDKTGKRRIGDGRFCPVAEGNGVKVAYGVYHYTDYTGVDCAVVLHNEDLFVEYSSLPEMKIDFSKIQNFLDPNYITELSKMSLDDLWGALSKYGWKHPIRKYRDDKNYVFGFELLFDLRAFLKKNPEFSIDCGETFMNLTLREAKDDLRFLYNHIVKSRPDLFSTIHTITSEETEEAIKLTRDRAFVAVNGGPAFLYNERTESIHEDHEEDRKVAVVNAKMGSDATHAIAKSTHDLAKAMVDAAKIMHPPVVKDAIDYSEGILPISWLNR